VVDVGVADFNGDGKIDLAVSQRDVSLLGVGWISILLGNGAGRFSAAAGSPLELAGLAAVSDVNADGKADLVLDQEEERRVAVLLGDGSGHFTPAPGSPYAAGTYPRAIAVADLNGDEKPDLVAVAHEGLWILLGTGFGRFAAARKVTTKSGPLAVADFNGDKKQDLAVAGTKLSILLGNGAGRFSPAPGSPMKGDYRSIAMADVNRDGKADLVAASSKSVVVLLGHGAAASTEPAARRSGCRCRSIRACAPLPT
jgi:hypothetical protein